MTTSTDKAIHRISVQCKIVKYETRCFDVSVPEGQVMDNATLDSIGEYLIDTEPVFQGMKAKFRIHEPCGTNIIKSDIEPEPHTPVREIPQDFLTYTEK